MEIFSHLKDKIKRFNPFKFDEEENFWANDIHIFIETGNVKPREDKSYCLIGYFEDDQIYFTDILSDKTSRTHDIYKIAFDGRKFNYVTFSGDSKLLNDKSLKYTAKFNNSYLDGETIDAFYNLVETNEGLTQEIICDHPHIINAITKMENSQKFTRTDIVNLADEINLLIEQKLEKEQQANSQSSK